MAYSGKRDKKMTESSLVFSGKVVHGGIFDFKDVYKFIYEWLTSYDYILVEKKYSEKIKATGKDLEVAWECYRKISDYFRYKIKVSIRVFNMIDVEATRDGVKVNRNKGEIEMKFDAFLERDYEGKWESSPITKFLRGIYDKYIIRTTIKMYEDRLDVEVEEAIAQVKSFLALEGKR